MGLTEAGYDLSGGLDVVSVRERVEWRNGLDCYELRGGCLSDMASQICSLLQ